MQKAELIDLASRWWKNKIKYYLDELNEDLNHNEKDSCNYKKFSYMVNDASNRLDLFENHLRELLENTGDHAALFISRDGKHSIINDALIKAGITPCMFYFSVYTVISNDTFLLIRYPVISYYSIISIQTENDYIDYQPI